ncbi:hypothetical protein ACTMTF_35730 [Nonomuraea sp. ZG12]|uniref:hypothetical protein n=1 Tax=Nonomuraea sp. ZG12 TaxID=3452207 RepID=UPI003F89F1D3
MRRRSAVRDVQAKIQADIDAGRLAADTQAAVLGRFFATVLQGMSQQACDGATRTELEAIADTALAAWPADK